MTSRYTPNHLFLMIWPLQTSPAPSLLILYLLSSHTALLIISQNYIKPFHFQVVYIFHAVYILLKCSEFSLTPHNFQTLLKCCHSQKPNLILFPKTQARCSSYLKVLMEPTCVSLCNSIKLSYYIIFLIHLSTSSTGSFGVHPTLSLFLQCLTPIR